MISILIPIGSFPFFVDICTKNIIETTDSDVDITFLTTKTLNQDLEEALRKIVGSNIHHMRCDRDFEDGKYVHLKLLDWAFYHGNLSEVVYIQHADVLWLQNQWLDEIKSFCSNFPGCIAYTIPYKICNGHFRHIEHKFSISDGHLLRTHDFAGVYNRELFVKDKLTFTAGKIGENVNVSANLRNLIQKKQIKWYRGSNFLKIGDEVDGSDTIALEIYAKYPGMIKEISMSKKLIHCWDLFAISKDMKRQNSALYINRTLEKSLRSLSTYSWISSSLFDRNSLVFPWMHLKSILPGCKKSNFCNAVEKYIQPRDVERDTFGISRITFKDFTYKSKIALI